MEDDIIKALVKNLPDEALKKLNELLDKEDVSEEEIAAMLAEYNVDLEQVAANMNKEVF